MWAIKNQEGVEVEHFQDKRAAIQRLHEISGYADEFHSEDYDEEEED